MENSINDPRREPVKFSIPLLLLGSVTMSPIPREYHSIHLYLSFARREDVDFFGGETNFLRWRETFFFAVLPVAQRDQLQTLAKCFFSPPRSSSLEKRASLLHSLQMDKGGVGVEERISVVLKQGRLAD